jgi:protein SCO1/2
LKLGDTLPDVSLRKEDGSVLPLHDFRGQALAITFFYSRCSAATFCPLVSHNFDATQALLARLGVASRCHLLSISIDPEHDTTEVLAGYSKANEADPQVWTFATGHEQDLRRLGDAVGLEFRRTEGRIDHNLRTVVIDPAGRIRRIFRGDGWTPQELAAELRTATLHER